MQFESMLTYFYQLFSSNKEMILLVGIFISNIKQYVTIKVHIANVEKKQAVCDGIFNLHDYKILEIDKQSKESNLKSLHAEAIATKALNGIRTIDKKVSKIHKIVDRREGQRREFENRVDNYHAKNN